MNTNTNTTPNEQKTWAIMARYHWMDRCRYVTPNGHLNHLKIHAALYTETEAKTEAEGILTLNNDIVEAKAVKLLKD